MVWLVLQICLLVLMTGQVKTVQAQDLATTFTLPLKGYPLNDGCLEWGNYNSDFPGKKHVADDACSPAGTPVYAVAHGMVKFAGKYKSCPNWISLLIVEHTLPSGEVVCSIYGHTIPDGVKAGDTVSRGQPIGKITNGDSCWSDHIHFGMYKGPYSGVKCSYNEQKPGEAYCFAHGYLATSEFPGKYTNPTKFVTDFKPYYYDNNATSCGGPVVGGSNTGWYYTCYDERSYFTAGESVSTMIRIQDVWVNHSFKVEAYKNGNYQWNWSPGWNYVDQQWGWKYSHFWPTLWNSTPGNWEMKFYLDSGAGYKLLDSASFLVK
jgi:hypothetical protein